MAVLLVAFEPPAVAGMALAEVREGRRSGVIAVVNCSIEEVLGKGIVEAAG